MPFLAEGIRWHPDNSLASVTITFRADVPALGFRTYWATAWPASWRGTDAAWSDTGGTAIANEAFAVEADPAQGGALVRLADLRTGTDLLQGLGNELVLTEEYAAHPRWGEGPWLLSPKGTGHGFGGGRAKVRAQALPGRVPADRRVLPRRAAGHPGDHAVERH